MGKSQLQSPRDWAKTVHDYFFQTIIKDTYLSSYNHHHKTFYLALQYFNELVLFR